MLMNTLLVPLSQKAACAALAQIGDREISLSEHFEALIEQASGQEAKVSTASDASFATAVGAAVQEAIQTSRNLAEGTQFKVQRACPTTWATLTVAERKSVGKQYRSAVEKMERPLARHVRKNTSGHSIFERI